MQQCSGLWSIDYRSGHCKHPLGLDAFVGTSDSARFTPILGPYSKKDLSERQVAIATSDLLKTIERSSKARISVFGTVDRSYRGERISVIGIKEPWIPDPSARTNWLLKCLSIDELQTSTVDLMELIQNEWTITGAKSRILHCSGIEFRFTKECVSSRFSRMLADISGSAVARSASHMSFLHRDLINDSIYALAKSAYAVISRVYALDLPEKLLRLDVNVATNALKNG